MLPRDAEASWGVFEVGVVITPLKHIASIPIVSFQDMMQRIVSLKLPRYWRKCQTFDNRTYFEFSYVVENEGKPEQRVLNTGACHLPPSPPAPKPVSPPAPPPRATKINDDTTLPEVAEQPTNHAEPEKEVINPEPDPIPPTIKINSTDDFPEVVEEHRNNWEVAKIGKDPVPTVSLEEEKKASKSAFSKARKYFGKPKKM